MVERKNKKGNTCDFIFISTTMESINILKKTAQRWKEFKGDWDEDRIYDEGYTFFDTWSRGEIMNLLNAIEKLHN